MQNPMLQRLVLILLCCCGWFAVITQLVLLLQTTDEPLTEALTRFISYFTIETNLLLAIAFSFLLLAPRSTPGSFFSKGTIQTALTVYIFMVGLIYNTILRFLWSPTGLQQVVDELLHSVIPILAIIYWVLFTPKDELHWKKCFAWLIYPLLYIGFVLLRGENSGFYPYPFIDTRKLGLNKVFVNALGIAFLFLLTALAFVYIAGIIRRNKQQSQSALNQ